MKQIENTLQDLKCMLIEDGYTEANIVMRTLIEAQEQVKNCSIPDVSKRTFQYNQLLQWGDLQYFFKEEKDGKILLANAKTEQHPDYNDWWVEACDVYDC